MDNIVDKIPPELRNEPLARLMVTFCREGKKDIKRLPEEFIQALAGQIGDAFIWVARGDYADVVESGGNSTKER